MPARLPKVPVVPGDYAVEWFVDDRSLAGELSLEPNRPPLAELFGHVVPPNSSSNVRGFPEEYHFDRFTGRLRSNLDVVLTDAHISTWFPQRSHLSARHAIVGMNVSEVLGDAFCHARFQLTSLDLLFGVAPVQSVTWPPEGAPHLSGRYAIDTNPHADQEWIDDTAGITVQCTYEIQVPLSGHEHYVAFAPTISIASDQPLTVDQWLSEWVMPLLRLAALATRQPQRLSWLTISTTPRTASDDEPPRSNITGTLFGSGIEQTPYEAEYRDEWREQHNRPLFTFATIPMSLPELIQNWRVLEQKDNPFVELSESTLRQTDLPARAKFLYLVQALEALHSYEHLTEDDEAQRSFELRRSVALDSLADVILPEGTLRFIKDKWSKRRDDSLDRRLRDLIRQMPEPVRALVSEPPAGNVLQALSPNGSLPIEALLRALRNDLSHGNRTYVERDLRPWVETVETMCRAHTLRLLGFHDDAVVAGLATFPPMPPALEDIQVNGT